MMRIPSKQALLLLCLLLIATSSSQIFAAAGTSSAEFLRISVFSRGSSLAGASVAAADGAGALFYNPAGVARHGSAEVSISHSELYQDLSLQNLSVALPLSDRAGLGIGVTYVGYGDIPGYDAGGSSTHSLSAYSVALSVALSYGLSEWLSLGVTAKPLQEKLDTYSATTVAFDFGAMADAGRFSFGFQAANVGGSLKYLQEENELPTFVRIGAAYSDFSTGSVLCLALSRERGGDFRLASGMEYLYSSSLAFRIGYAGTLSEAAVNASDGFGLGIGLNLEVFSLDYSYHPGNTLEGIHQVTASHRFGR